MRKKPGIGQTRGEGIMAEDRTCKHCKFWIADMGYGDLSYEVGSCDSEAWSTVGVAAKDGVQIIAYQDDYATFSTGEDFGCVHFVKGR